MRGGVYSACQAVYGTKSFYFGAEIALRMSGRFCASSNLRTITSHLVDLQMCFVFALTASENKVRPAARSTASTTSSTVSPAIRTEHMNEAHLERRSSPASLRRE